jgi:hypothetical protein
VPKEALKEKEGEGAKAAAPADATQPGTDVLVLKLNVPADAIIFAAFVRFCEVRRLSVTVC